MTMRIIVFTVLFALVEGDSIYSRIDNATIASLPINCTYSQYRSFLEQSVACTSVANCVGFAVIDIQSIGKGFYSCVRKSNAQYNNGPQPPGILKLMMISQGVSKGKPHENCELISDVTVHFSVHRLVSWST